MKSLLLFVRWYWRVYLQNVSSPLRHVPHSLSKDMWCGKLPVKVTSFSFFYWGIGLFWPRIFLLNTAYLWKKNEEHVRVDLTRFANTLFKSIVMVIISLTFIVHFSMKWVKYSRLGLYYYMPNNFWTLRLNLPSEHINYFPYVFISPDEQRIVFPAQKSDVLAVFVARFAVAVKVF